MERCNRAFSNRLSGRAGKGFHKICTRPSGMVNRPLGLRMTSCDRRGRSVQNSKELLLVTQRTFLMKPWLSRHYGPVTFVLLGACLLWSLWPALAAMADRWSSDPRYAHGYFVPMFSLALLWMRRARLDGCKAEQKHLGTGFRGAGGGLPARWRIFSHRHARGPRPLALPGWACSAPRRMAAPGVGVAFDRVPRVHDPAPLAGGERSGTAASVRSPRRPARTSCRPSVSWPSPKGT